MITKAEGGVDRSLGQCPKFSRFYFFDGDPKENESIHLYAITFGISRLNKDKPLR